MAQVPILDAPNAGALVSNWGLPLAKPSPNTPFHTTASDIRNYVLNGIENVPFTQLTLENPAAPVDQRKSLIAASVSGNVEFLIQDDGLPVKSSPYLEVSRQVGGTIDAVRLSCSDNGVGIINDLGLAAEFKVTNNLGNLLTIAATGNTDLSGELQVFGGVIVADNDLDVLLGNLDVSVGNATVAGSISAGTYLESNNISAPLNRKATRIESTAAGNIEWNVNDDTGASLGKLLEVERQASGAIDNVNWFLGSTGVATDKFQWKNSNGANLVTLDGTGLFDVMGACEANSFFTTGTINANQNISSNFGNIVAISGDLQSVNGDLNLINGNAIIGGTATAGGNITSGAGNIIANSGNIQASAGDIVATVGKAVIGGNIEMGTDFIMSNASGSLDQKNSGITALSTGDIHFRVLADAGFPLGNYLEVARQPNGKVDSVTTIIGAGGSGINNKLEVGAEFTVRNNLFVPVVTIDNDGNITAGGIATADTVNITGAQTPTWTVTPDVAGPFRTFDANSSTLTEVKQVLGTLLDDLKNNGGFIT